jgi:hypothetical protein
MPLQAEEALGPISILRGSCGTVALYGLFINFFFLAGLRISLYQKFGHPLRMLKNPV